MSRDEAQRRIIELFGAPGEGWDTVTGRRLLTELVERLGLAALTDEAVLALAALHEEVGGRRNAFREAAQPSRFH